MGVDIITDWLIASLDLFRLMAPYLLLGFTLAGILHVVVRKEWVAGHLGGRGFWASVKASLLGTPLPICSCGVVPFADLLKRQGASKSAITSFLISTPQTGVDSILASYAILGLPLALWKVLTAMVSGVLGGTVAGWVDRDERPAEATEADSCGDSCCASEAAPGVQRRTTIVTGTQEAISYGWGVLIKDIALWLLIGTLLGGAIATFVPQSFLTRDFSNPYLQMVAVLLVAVPLYVCATGSLPVAAALVLKGMPLGAAIVFLIAGPATNVATLTILGKVLGRKTLAVYLGTILVASYAFGVAFGLVFPGAALPAASAALHHEHGGLGSASWWEWACTLLLLVLVIRGLAIRWQEKTASRRASPGEFAEGETHSMDTIELKVTGMSCGHCRGQVDKALRSVDGVDEVVVSLEESSAQVRGAQVDVAKLVAAIQAKGFEASAR